jgi:hypothetical protein
MYRYLFITKNREHFLVEEPSGNTLHQVFQFLYRMKAAFPRAVLRKFKGRVQPAEYADLDLVLAVPPQTAHDLLGQIVEGFAHVLLNHPEPESRVSCPKKEFRVEVGNRGLTDLREPVYCRDPLEIGSKLLVGLLHLDDFQVDWLQGTSRRRAVRKRRLAFFIDRRPDGPFAGKRGRFVAEADPGEE